MKKRNKMKCENMWEQRVAPSISRWLEKYATKNHINCFVVGVSGGVDSAVTSTLCAQTGLKTYVLNIPIFSKLENTSLSSLHCDWLTEKFQNVETLNIDATDAFDKFEAIFRTTNRVNALASANSKSRMRMMILYYVASVHNGLVVGTGNRVEDFGVGFYTKYGDGGVGISPIADLTKTQVRGLGTYIGIDEKILTAPPTDGLWEDSRTDEEQIGASYEELEWAMETISYQQQQVNLTPREEEVINIYNKFHNKNRHKMVEIPVFKLKEC